MARYNGSHRDADTPPEGEAAAPVFQGYNSTGESGLSQDADFPFDFDAFEKSEAEAAAKSTTFASDPSPAASLERINPNRTLIPRTWLPPSELVVETRPVGNMTVVTLRGRLNENFRGAEIGAGLSGVVVFDLSQVDRISSFGVKGWLQMLERARFTACYLFQCSEAVINQITMMRNFCGPGRIHSFLAPYACDACGEEFSAVYEAVADREAILGRSPVAVRCPRCTAPAKMADDPWAYLALDEHLLDHVPADLEQVIEHATGIHRMDPIEKFVSDEETRIRINAPLDARLRLGRALNGVEGRVVIDLSARQDLQTSGLQKLVDSIRELEPEVTEVWIDGANRELLEMLLRNPPPRTYISTAWVVAIAQATGIRRPVLVDLKRKRNQLLRGEIPSVDAGWARGPMRYEDSEIIMSAARALFPPNVVSTPTPAPLPSITPPTVHERSYATNRHTQPPQTGVYRQQPQVSPNFMLQVMAFVGVTLLLSTLAFTLVFFVAWYSLSQTQTVGTDLRPTTDMAQFGWDGGSPLPPPWVDEQVVADAMGLRAVGLERGDTVEIAAERSRIQASYRMVQYLASQLAAAPVGPSLGVDPGATSADIITARFIADVSAWAPLKRINQAVKREADGFMVATQYQVDTVAVQRLLSHYGQIEEFRGLRVGRRFPFRDSGASSVVVVRAESWFKSVSPGDSLVQIGTIPISSLDDFQRIAAEAWKATSEGGTLVMTAEHQGARTPLEFTKPAGTFKRSETKIDLLPLELPK